jgi:hypothetical protein
MQPDIQVYDLEIVRDIQDNPGGWENPEALGLASAVIYDFRADKYSFFLHPTSLDQLILQLDDHINVSFNGVMFDSRVILGNDREVIPIRGVPYLIRVIGRKKMTALGDRTPSWVENDLLLQVIMAKHNLETAFDAYKALQSAEKSFFDGTFNLDAISRSTFGLSKSGKGELAPSLYRKGLHAELFEYNLNDVRLTRKLWEFQKAYGFIVDGKGVTHRLNMRKDNEEKS